MLHMFLVSLQKQMIVTMAKNLLNKYVWLVETIYKAGHITFEEINEKWLENDMSEGVELALRTFHKWRIAAEEMFGLIIECERKGGYHYYIANSDEIKSGSLRSWLLNTMSVSNLLIIQWQEAYMLTKLMEQSKLREIRPSIRKEIDSMTYEY